MSLFLYITLYYIQYSITYYYVYTFKLFTNCVTHFSRVKIITTFLIEQPPEKIYLIYIKMKETHKNECKQY